MTIHRVINDVGIVYFKCGIIYLAYLLSKIYSAKSRKVLRPPLYRKIRIYIICAACAGAASLFFSTIHDGDVEDAHIIGVDYGHAVVFFTMLIFPALLGAKIGFVTKEQFDETSSSPHID